MSDSLEIFPVGEMTKRVRGDLQLLNRAVVNRWPIPAEKMATIVDRVLAIVENSPDEMIVLSAVDKILKMNAQNAKAEPIEHHHQHDLGPITEANLAEHKRRIAARITRSS